MKVLFGAAAARCSHPDCRQSLLIPSDSASPRALVADIAHIVAHRDDGPRGDNTMSAADRDDYGNLILLCPTHHRLIDALPDAYPPELLRAWRTEHEAWVERELDRNIRRVSFTELAAITRALADGVVEPSTDFDVLDPAAKMKRNVLGARTAKLLRMGLMRTFEVQAYLVHHATLDPDFPERLKARFVDEYRRLRDKRVEGDALFAAVFEFAAQGAASFELRAAALAVVCYLFETCELFER